MCDEKKFYEEINHMIDSRDIYGYIKMMINPYGRPFEGTIFEFGNKLMDYIIRMEKQPKAGEWIPCSERFPEKRDWYLALFKEPDSDFVLIPKIADYLMGQRTEFTTEEGWIISNCTDMTEYDNYYKKLKCIAWMPLPEPYKEEVNQ